MNARATGLTMVLAALVLTSPTLHAQNTSTPASVTATVLSSVTTSKLTDMTFAPAFASAGIVNSATPATWSGATDVGNGYTVAFTLPSVLNRAGGGTIPFACPNPSAKISGFNGGPDLLVNPNITTTVSSVQNTTGTFSITLSHNMGISNPCTVNLTGALPGTYTGTVTLTITVL